jgi:hypothetical protein
MSDIDGLGRAEWGTSSLDPEAPQVSEALDSDPPVPEDAPDHSPLLAASVPLPPSEPSTPGDLNTISAEPSQITAGLTSGFDEMKSKAARPSSQQAQTQPRPQVQQHPLQSQSRSASPQHALQANVGLRPASPQGQPTLETQSPQASRRSALQANVRLRPASQRLSQAPSFSLFGGKALGEISNILSETSAFLENENRHVASAGTGFTGETMFALGGLWQAGAAGGNFVNLYNSASSPEDRKKLVEQSIEFMRGVSNTVSGLAGIASHTPNANPIAGKISSVAWALSEGVNAALQTYEALSNGRGLNRDQIVHLGQIVGSVAKFAGIVASLKSSENGPIIAQAVGSGISISSGVYNLYNKGYITSVGQYYRNFMDYLRAMSSGTASQPMSTARNPHPDEMV